MAAPPYGIHRISARYMGAEITLVALVNGVHDLPAMASAAHAAGSSSSGIVYVANPHNPTGTAVSLAALETLADEVPASWLIVVDEAYHEFMDASARCTALDLLGRHPGLVVTRTFSKAYGMAGMRVGYAIASAEVLEPVSRIRPPFNVSTPSLAAAAAVLDDAAYLAQTVRDTLVSRVSLEAACLRLGLRFLPSQANFVLIEDRDGWPEALAADAISVRPGAMLGVPGWARISLPRPADVPRVVAILERALSAGGPATTVQS
jgi:histidinol-phosphate aminotransferase